MSGSTRRLIAVFGAILALAAATPVVAIAKNGADDPPGHVHHGGDDGPRHR